MNWIPLDNEGQIDRIREESNMQTVVIFKHSTRCSISAMALARLEREASPEHTRFYLLDLLRFRGISDRLAAVFSVRHESPQVLKIRDGVCIYHESHGAINMDELRD